MQQLFGLYALPSYLSTMNQGQKAEVSGSSKFNIRAMRIMNMIAILVFILAIVYKIFFSK
ncbi:DUF6728 family protein [Sphingobacterium lumbrici]|uniref:DUF6728 family protein n=1 Tax=Sphingobacterium lumbrici TaxID=2559600 RepID=UPI00112B7698|nr:DUF6728 family protein [Sphingobacterium lumbrici]